MQMKRIVIILLSFILFMGNLQTVCASEIDDRDIIPPEYEEIAREAKADLQRILEEKEIFAVLYLTDTYEVRESADKNFPGIITIPSARTVQILDVEVSWEYREEWEEYLPIVWYKTQFYEGEQLYSGYIEEHYLAYSDELLLQWKDNWHALFPMENQLYSVSNSYEDIKQFPTSYQAKLRSLKDKHPNWIFVPMKVNRTWDSCVSEQIGDYSWIGSGQPAEYRAGKINDNWYYASRSGIEYYMDPRNFLSEDNIFQFEQNTYNPSYHTLNALQSFLSNTFMKGSVPKDPQDRTYAEVIYQSGQSRGLSPFNLAARVIQEQGTKGDSAMISGTHSKYPGYYNHYNIGASGNTDAQVLENGLSYAKKKGWNTITKSLEGGAEFIGNGYILQGQDTLYLQKFDIEHGSSYIHQYMQNIMAPYTEGRSMKSMYVKAGSLNSAFVFKIPVFLKMPSEYDFSLSAASKTLYRGVEGEDTYELRMKCNGSWLDSNAVTYASDNTNVAQVSSEGVITALGSGTATISVQVKFDDMEEAVTLECIITVKSPLQDIELNVSYQELYLEEGLPEKVPYLKEDGTTGYKEKSKGELPTQVTLEVSYLPADTTDNRKVTWTVADETIISLEPIELKTEDITAKAIVKSKASGTTTVTAKVGNITKTVEVVVRVPMLEASLNQNELMTEENKITLYKGRATQLTVSYAPYNTTDRVEPVWSVDKNANPAVVEIIDGNIIAKKAGNTIVRAAMGPFDGSQKELTLQIIVEEYKVTFMNENGKEVTMSVPGEYGKTLENLTTTDGGELPWEMEKEGNVFAGWYTGETGTGDRVTEKTILYGDMILYPYFIEGSEEENVFYVTPIGSVTYTGANLKPDVKVHAFKEVNGEKQIAELVKGIDYVVSYSNNKQVNDGTNTEELPTVRIEGKGQYAEVQPVEKSFLIIPKNISHIDVTAKNISIDYTGKIQKLRPDITDAGRTLRRNVDYTVEYPDTRDGAYREAGTYAVKITGMGNYTGTKYVYITITKRVMMKDAYVNVATSVKFNNGNSYNSIEDIAECKPPVTIKHNGNVLRENKDYTLTYSNNTQIGTANIEITGLGSYIGSRIVSFRIIGTDISQASINGIVDAEYSGDPVEQEKIQISKKDGTKLREGLDYTISYSNNTEVGKGKAEITGINGYTGTVTKSFNIEPYDIEKNSMEYKNPQDEEGEKRPALEYEFISEDMDETDAEHTAEYVKGGAKPLIRVTFKGKKLEEEKDYKVAYENNNIISQSDAEQKPAVVITGKGRFTGSIGGGFSIVQKDISRIAKIEVKDIKFKNRKGYCFAEPILTDTNGKRLEAGEDYILKYTYVYDTVLHPDVLGIEITKLAGSEVEKEDIPEKLAQGGGRPYIKVTAYGAGNYKETSEISATYKILENTSWLGQILGEHNSQDGGENIEEVNGSTEVIGNEEVNGITEKMIAQQKTSNVIGESVTTGQKPAADRRTDAVISEQVSVKNEQDVPKNISETSAISSDEEGNRLEEQIVTTKADKLGNTLSIKNIRYTLEQNVMLKKCLKAVIGIVIAVSTVFVSGVLYVRRRKNTDDHYFNEKEEE